VLRINPRVAYNTQHVETYKQRELQVFTAITENLNNPRQLTTPETALASEENTMETLRVSINISLLD